MPIEIYVGSDLDPVIQRVRPSIVEYSGTSKLWPFAQELVEEGIDGLRELMGRVRQGRDLYPHEVRQIIEGDSHLRGTFGLNHAGVVMGVSIHAIESVLLNGSFSHSDLIGAYNAAVSNAELGLEMDIPNSPDRKLDNSELQGLYRIAREDRTLEEFFAAINFSVLPAELQRFIEKTHTIDDIRAILGPIYKKKTRKHLEGRRLLSFFAPRQPSRR